MKNYKIIIQYDGTKYNGWQKQGNTKNTIQERFENVLEKLCGRPVEIFSSGRTDAGVHADAQTANFKCDTGLGCDKIKEYLNTYLPKDILVKSVDIADERFHSRLNAVSKTYEYSVAVQKPDVFIRKYVYECNVIPDINKMRDAAVLLSGYHDFKGFSSVGRTKKSTVRCINYIDITEESGVVKIKINGNGFLYNMVRIICGTLYEIGIGKKDKSVINVIFESRNREMAGVTLPACGLKLLEVIY